MEVNPHSTVIAALVAGLIAGYGIAMPVGAVATYLVALTARTSVKIGAFAALGVATADGIYALIATFGGAALAPVIRSVAVPLRWGSAAILVVLAIRGAVTAIKRYRVPPSTLVAEIRPARVYLGLLGITIMNPTTVIYFAALVLGSQTMTAPTHLEQIVFVLAAFAASASWQLLLAAGGALLGRTLTSRRGQLITALTASTVISALAVHLLVTG